MSMKKILWAILLLILSFQTLYITYTSTYEYNINKATLFLTSNAEKRSKGLCARYIRLALEAGGCDTWGHPLTAEGYEDFLLDLDFSSIDPKGYQARKGDIVVFDAVNGHPYGHIAMWNGQQWISDFRQRGFYVANEYRKVKDFKFYRMMKKKPERKFRLRHQIAWICECFINSLHKIHNR